MRLAAFIVKEMETILVQWEAFAATILPGANMSAAALRDHAEQIMLAIANDLSTAQTPEQQSVKSKGLAPKLLNAPATAAQTHGFLRANSGFDIQQMASEYRALRASVLRLWIGACLPDPPDMEDMIRFNEAIDQALAESVGFFGERVEQARNLFLGMLGHDLRSPLQAIQMAAMYLQQLDAGREVAETAARLASSGVRMKSLLDDLLAFNRTNLGLGIPISRSEVDAADLFREALDEILMAHPDRKVELQITGATAGVWDGLALQRVLGNLVVNAIKYGAQDAPVRVVLSGDQDALSCEVRNSGAPIDPMTLERLFEPLRRGVDADQARNSDGSLGLGLFIARQIVKAHGGELHARSTASETVFDVRLPRYPVDAARSKE